ncbi:hypothetical protein D3C78_1194330 [compost metagenome]
MIDDQVLGNPTGQFRAKILLDHAKRQVYAGAHPGGGPDRSVDDENSIVLYMCFRKLFLKIARMKPVRGDSSTIEQSCFTKYKGPRADRCSAPCGLGCLTQLRYQVRRRGCRMHRASDDQRINLAARQRTRFNRGTKRVGNSATALREESDAIQRLIRRAVSEFERGNCCQSHDLEAVRQNKANRDHRTNLCGLT